MDNRWLGGGWMMGMKATRGTTFNWDSSYWTSNNVLNESHIILMMVTLSLNYE
ncbi:MAG: hypothetical protein CM15mV6_0450 [uncultured marine virus]|nr:MAG: hypothetical protein CM15mV6_0450 [uncultured marine virus]